MLKLLFQCFSFHVARSSRPSSVSFWHLTTMAARCNLQKRRKTTTMRRPIPASVVGPMFRKLRRLSQDDIRRLVRHAEQIELKRPHAKRDQPVSYKFGIMRNYVEPYARYTDDDSIHCKSVPSFEPAYVLHPIEMGSQIEAMEMQLFYEAELVKKGEIDVVKYPMHDYDTRSKGRRRTEQDDVNAALLAAAAARRRRSLETTPAVGLTCIERLPNELQQAICRYAIASSSCACPFCCDSTTIRHLLDLSETSRENLSAVVKLHGNYAMKYFAGLDPKPFPEQESWESSLRGNHIRLYMEMLRSHDRHF